MSTSLASRFRAGNGRKIKWQGNAVYSMVQLGVADGDIIEIARVSASTTRAQGLKLAVDKGNLRANGVLVPTAAVWTHTSPETAALQVVGKRARSVDIWNCWSFAGVDSSWLGNAGILVERAEGYHVLRCSDGLGDPTFDDLVARITVRRG